MFTCLLITTPKGGGYSQSPNKKPSVMGRQENELVGDGPVFDLARRLRELRHAAGDITYRAMRGKYSPAALNRAASGTRCPTWQVVQEFACACGGDAEELRLLWEKAHASSARRSRSQKPRDDRADFRREPSVRHTAKPPNPWQKKPTDFVRELRLLRERAGKPNWVRIAREWERNTPKGYRHGRRDLPKSTLYDALKPDRLGLPHLEVVQKIVHACDGDLTEWTGAWQNIRTREFEAHHRR